MSLFLSHRLSRQSRRTAQAWIFVLAVISFCSIPARAIIVRGRVTDALGKPVPGARVQLIEQGQVVTIAYAAQDGTYEVRSSDSGRFTLLASSAGFLPGVGEGFYGSSLDVLSKDVVLATDTVRQEVSVSATGIPIPTAQLTAPVSVIPGELLATRVDTLDELRQTLGAVLVQTGQRGGQTSLFMRGGNSTANLVLIDGVPADDVGGTFDYGTVSSTGIGRMELYRGPDSATYGTDASAGVVTISTPKGDTLRPVLTYSGDAGNLHTYRNEATLGGTLRKLDYFGGFSRFDTSNAVARDQFHSATSVANLGYNFNGNTQVRFTIRNAVSATGLPNAHDFYGVSADGKQGDQDLYSAGTLEHTSQKDWHNLVRYGIARKREQQQYFSNQGTSIEVFPGFSEYFGNVVTIRGGNGYTATGRAAFLTGNDNMASNTDQLYYQSDWSPSPHFNGLFGFRYDKERGVFNAPPSAFSGATREITQRTNFEYSLQFQGQFFSRLFYSAGGAVEKNHLYGIAGTPRFGLSYVPVRTSRKVFHGTRLRANFATGVQEPTLALEYFGLYGQLLRAGDTADIARYNLGKQDAERSRTYDVGIDQNILGDKLTLKAGYFHNVFDRQIEAVTGANLARYFGLKSGPFNDPINGQFYYTGLYVNSLAYRAQGAEGELTWQPKNRLLFRTGYTYLNAHVLKSFASDAVAANQGTPTQNPNLPGIAIGAEGPLVGNRPFRRPPHSGFFAATYARPKYTVMLQGAYASRSDDSTFLDGFTPTFDNSLLLPNRNLDFGYTKLDLGGTYRLARRLTVFTQLENLLNNQHIGPIGYPGLPFTVRAGIKARIGGD